ncbi:hypothetical protein [Cytobacillus praedii]|uniref:hypothetical protein n=1 Tax=Cytobacillus praedii TaxID=1742358 RepID=UPI002E1D5D05|nr:hypothetical protein [Cytobacillus praedii]
MALGIGKDSQLKPSSQYVPYNRSGNGYVKRVPGRLVGLIAVRSKTQKSKYNPLVIKWAVSRYRKDLNKVVGQTNIKACLPRYEQSLFDSCFKNW